MVALAAVLAVLAIGVPQAAAAPSRDHRCPGSFGPDGEPGQGFFGEIRAERVSCHLARKVIGSFLREGGLQAGEKGKVVDGFHCRVRLIEGDDPDPTGMLRCSRQAGRQVIRSTGHP